MNQVPIPSPDILDNQAAWEIDALIQKAQTTRTNFQAGGPLIWDVEDQGWVGNLIRSLPLDLNTSLFHGTKRDTAEIMTRGLFGGKGIQLFLTTDPRVAGWFARYQSGGTGSPVILQAFGFNRLIADPWFELQFIHLETNPFDREALKFFVSPYLETFGGKLWMTTDPLRFVFSQFTVAAL